MLVNLTGRRRPALAIAVAFVVTTAMTACALPAKNVSPFDPVAGKLKSVDIVLDAPAFAVSGGARSALDSEGWSNGSLERKFCSGLVTKLQAEQVQARCYQSMWGMKLPFAKSSPPGSGHVLTIRPVRMTYGVETRYGAVFNPGFNPALDTVTSLTDTRSGATVWSAEITAIFAPVDPSGSRRYAVSLIDALRSAGAL
jgi:hypothetical protein